MSTRSSSQGGSRPPFRRAKCWTAPPSRRSSSSISAVVDRASRTGVSAPILIGPLDRVEPLVPPPEERPPLSSFEILRAIPREAWWVTVHSLPDSLVESGLVALAGLEEERRPVVRSLGPVRAAYGVARGDWADVVHLFQADGEVAALWPELLRVAGPGVALEELESEVPCLRITLASDSGPIELVVAHDGVNVHACGRLETKPLIALGRAWLEENVRELRLRGGDADAFVRWLRFVSTVPAPGACRPQQLVLAVENF